MNYSSKQVEVEGNQISYIDEGNRGRAPLIFIHGFPFNKTSWEPQVDAFKNDYRVIAYDVRGHGDSDAGTEEFRIDQFAKDLFDFLDALELDKVIICGLSMGGYIILNGILQQPDRIIGLILCDTQCAADSNEGRKKRIDTIELIQHEGLKQYAHDSVQKLFSPVSLQSKKELVSFIENTILTTRIETITQTLMALADRKEMCATLYMTEVPVLILVGEDDKVTNVEAHEKMKELIPNSELHVISKAGHLSNLENAEEFNTHVSAFLKKLA